MAGKTGRSGREGPQARENRELLAELREALEDEPPKRFIDASKQAVRDALKEKREGKS